MIEDDVRQEMHDYYVATCQSAIAKLLASYLGATWELPTYYEIMHPEKKKDVRTGEEIKDYVLSRLKGGE